MGKVTFAPLLPAAPPDLSRGYEQVKLGNVARYRDQLHALRSELAPSEPLTALSSLA